MRLQFVGCGDAFGSGGRYNTCFHLTGDKVNCLIDCGASSLPALKKLGIARDAIDLILITHFHGDHFAGLPFFMLDAQFSRRSRPLVIAGPEGIEMLRDGGTYVEMGQFTDAGSIQTSWHRICTKDLNVLGSWGFTGNDLPLGVDMLYRTRNKYPWLEMQTIYPFSEAGIGQAFADAMAMKTVKSTIVPWPELVE